MPLPLPNLDDRHWTDLVEESRALIPRYAPDWSDHNIHDPGITLMELFAWVSEMSLYRLNRIPERHRRTFLALLGFRPHAPRPAQTMLTFAPPTGADAIRLPAGLEFEATGPHNRSVPFRTLRDLTLVPVTLTTLLVDNGDGVLQDRSIDLRDGLPTAILGQNPQTGAAFYLGFDELPVQTSIAIGFLFQGPGNDAEERVRIIAEAAMQRKACRRVLPDISCGVEAQANDRDEAGREEAGREEAGREETPPPHHSARVVWEVFTSDPATPWQALEMISELALPTVGQVRDTTRALTLDGIVEVNLPATTQKTVLGTVVDPLVYVRVRLDVGAFDAPPLLLGIAPNSVVAEQATPVYQTLTIRPDAIVKGPAPQPGERRQLMFKLDKSGDVTELTFHDTIDAVLDFPDLFVRDYMPPTQPSGQPGQPGQPGQLTLELAVIGVGTGQPNQTLQLPQAPVRRECFALFTHVNDTWQAWDWQDDLHAATRTDFHFTLEATQGQITFGDGERGRVPSAGALVVAIYRTTLAENGNLAAGKTLLPVMPLRRSGLSEVEAIAVANQLSSASIVNRIEASGGLGAETLNDSIGRAVAVQHAHTRLLDLCAPTGCSTLDQLDQQRVLALQPPTRAVNLLDLERLALSVPGTHIARARAWAGIHPAYMGLHAPGVVTLVILPDLPVVRPEPSSGLLAAVHRYLDQRRMITTHLKVVGPHYLKVQIQASVRSHPFTDNDRIQEQIHQALDAFLDPRKGGPQGRGWPFGRNVYRSEIMQLLDGVPGVDHVLSLTLSAGDGEAQCGNLTLCPTWLVASGKHEVEVVGGR